MAYTYSTGWEYMPGSSEAGSVLTDAFLDMVEENRRHCEGAFERHAKEFRSAVPCSQKEIRGLKAGVCVRAAEADHGKRIGRGTVVYTIPDGGTLLRFVTEREVRLTAAKLLYAVRQRGLRAWLVSEGDKSWNASDISPCSEEGTEICRPTFVLRFRNLCNGRSAVRFFPEFGTDRDGNSGREGDDAGEPGLPECWQISDGIHSYPLELRAGERSELYGDTPDFAANLSDTLYELRPDPTFWEKTMEPWAGKPCGEFALREERESRAPQLCLTETAACDGERVLPFTDAPETASCCYVACDGALAGRPEEICLKFTISYETEERNLADVSGQMSDRTSARYARLYRKYPWLKMSEAVEEWKVAETLWEYFDGNLWRPLSGSGKREMGCGMGSSGEQIRKWKMPADMQPCVVQGEEHFYLRLRAVRVDNAYAARYRKTIPVLEHIRFEAGGRRLAPESCDLPDLDAADTALYLGFDRDVTCENRWYTGEKAVCFTGEQILGRGVRFDREACWVRWEESEDGTLETLRANYVEIAQVPETFEENMGSLPDTLRLPAGTMFHVETAGQGVADAISVSDARYDGGRAVIWDEEWWREGYFAHYGRLVSVADIGLLLRKSYPAVRLCSCDYAADAGELRLFLDVAENAERETAQILLPEIREWLEAAMRRMGALWMKDCFVRCTLRADSGER
ncbi:MAG: hypothetical protein NC091_07990 [Bacteroides sp.]|nr:hypothetical protein [Bacteroides sp.]